MEQSPGESNQRILQIALYVPAPHKVLLQSLCLPFKCSDETHRLNTHNATRSNALHLVLHLVYDTVGRCLCLSVALGGRPEREHCKAGTDDVFHVSKNGKNPFSCCKMSLAKKVRIPNGKLWKII